MYIIIKSSQKKLKLPQKSQVLQTFDTDGEVISQWETVPSLQKYNFVSSNPNVGNIPIGNSAKAAVTLHKSPIALSTLSTLLTDSSVTKRLKKMEVSDICNYKVLTLLPNRTQRVCSIEAEIQTCKIKCKV